MLKYKDIKVFTAVFVFLKNWFSILKISQILSCA